MNQDTDTETAANQNEQDAASRMNDLQKQLLELGIDVSSTIGKVSRSNLIKQLKQAKSRLKATQEAAVKAERDARFQPYRIYLVCDIEATCDSDSGFDFASFDISEILQANLASHSDRLL
ncbi:hypothetical protein QVD99_008306 [Batrachochytrium dendrobatidis]|nr:hypothetical protein QVD99_008306 [Batrachochytrium dendrobatidis]